MDKIVKENYTTVEAQAYRDFAIRLIESDNPTDYIPEDEDDFDGMVGNEDMGDFFHTVGEKSKAVIDKIKKAFTKQTLLDTLEAKLIDLQKQLPATGTPIEKHVHISNDNWNFITNGDGTSKPYLSYIPYMTDTLQHNKCLTAAEFMVDLCLDKIFPSIRTLGNNPSPDKYDELYNQLIKNRTYGQTSIYNSYLSKVVPVERYIELGKGTAVHGFVPKRSFLGGLCIIAHFGYSNDADIVEWFSTSVTGGPKRKETYTGDIEGLSLSQIKTMLHDTLQFITAIRNYEKEFEKFPKKMDKFYDEFFKLGRGATFYTNKRPLVNWVNNVLIARVLTGNQLSGPKVHVLQQSISVVNALYAFMHASVQNLK